MENSGSVHHFGCTKCGECCRGWRLPLSLAEATAWTERGQDIEILCLATPASSGPDAADPAALHHWNTSFPATCGALPVRIKLVLAAQLGAACPNLQPDLGCAIYEDRPQACRIYPAGLDPFSTVDPGQKRCPPDAWAPAYPAFLRDGACIDESYRHNQDRFHAAAMADVRFHQDLCETLNIRHAALSGEGCVIHRPSASSVLAALTQCSEAGPGPAPSWTIVSHDQTTIEALTRIKSQGIHVPPHGRHPDFNWDYLGFFNGPAGSAS